MPIRSVSRPPSARSWSSSVDESYILRLHPEPRQLLERSAQTLLPGGTDLREILAVFLEQQALALRLAVPAIQQYLHRRAHRRVAAHRGVHGDQCAARRRLQVRGPGDYPVQYRLAVLRLADLNIRRAIRGVDVIALGIHQVQTLGLFTDMAAEYETRFGAEARLLVLAGVARLDGAARRADVVHHFQPGVARDHGGSGGPAWRPPPGWWPDCPR